MNKGKLVFAQATENARSSKLLSRKRSQHNRVGIVLLMVEADCAAQKESALLQGVQCSFQEILACSHK